MPTPAKPQLFLYHPRQKVLSRLALNVTTGQRSARYETLWKLPRRELLVGWVTDADRMVLATIGRHSSRLQVHVWTAGGDHRQCAFELRQDSFPSSRFGTLSGTLVGVEDPDDEYEGIALGISPLLRTHLMGMGLRFPAKLYLDQQHLILTIDASAAYTLVIDCPLEQGEAQLHRLQTDCAPCTDERYPTRAGSYYFDGRLWQAKGCPEGLALQIFRVSDGTRLHHETWNSQSLRRMLQGKHEISSGLLPSLLHMPVGTQPTEPAQFLRDLGQNPLALSLVPVPNYQASVRLQTSGQSLPLTAMVSLGKVFTAGWAEILLPPDMLHQTQGYEGLVINDSLDVHQPDPRSRLAYGCSDALVQAAKYKGVKSPCMGGVAFNWMLSFIDTPYRGYWLLRQPASRLR